MEYSLTRLFYMNRSKYLYYLLLTYYFFTPLSVPFRSSVLGSPNRFLAACFTVQNTSRLSAVCAYRANKKCTEVLKRCAGDRTSKENMPTLGICLTGTHRVTHYNLQYAMDRENKVHLTQELFISE
jgi:hypothetical protein